MTEKLNKQSASGVVAFKVHPKANKISVAKAVETVYDVKVERVNMVTMPSKPKNFGRTSSRTAVWKKAIVTLKKGQVIQE
jgi:large subunit ribosomal protein L23